MVVSCTPGAVHPSISGAYYVLASGNVVELMANWSRVATNQFETDGSFRVTNTVSPAPRRQFFRAEAP